MFHLVLYFDVQLLLCASSMRKGIKKQIDALDKVIEAIQMYLPFATK